MSVIDDHELRYLYTLLQLQWHNTYVIRHHRKFDYKHKQFPVRNQYCDMSIDHQLDKTNLAVASKARDQIDTQCRHSMVGIILSTDLKGN